MIESVIDKYKTLFDQKCNKNDCTCFIDKLFHKNWGKCCKRHDNSYIFNFEKKTKDEIDLEFYECLKKNTWQWLAWAMYTAVSQSSIAKTYWERYRNANK